jgi:AcrR family transcriptional regulator
VIAREGYAGASLRKVAMQAGCTTGAVTYYFADRDAMITAVAQHIWDKWDSMRSGPGEHDKGLRQFLAWSSAEDSTEWMAAMEILIHTRHVPAFQEMYVRRYGDYRDAMTRSLAISQRNGLIRDDIPADMLTDQICAMADGWMLAMPSDPQRFTPQRINDLIDATMTLIQAPRRS